MWSHRSQQPVDEVDADRRAGRIGKPCRRSEILPRLAGIPRLLANAPLIALISDTLTLMVVSSGTLETHAVEEVMDNAMKTHFHEMREPQHALQSLADALPALGIVAAVLERGERRWVRLTNPPSVLGGMIGSALVGTFLGVLLAYGGSIGPLASRLKQVLEQDEQIYHAVKQVISPH